MKLSKLIKQYKTNPASGYHGLRFHVRKNHVSTLLRIKKQRGHYRLSRIRASTIQAWHTKWAKGGKISMAHAFIGQLRTMFSFGMLFLEDKECARLCMTLHKLRFKMPEPRVVRLTADQATAIRDKARWCGWHSIALAQALQFELMLRQKDCIGEWIPTSEPGESDTTFDGQKWIRGLRWEEIDENLILRHRTSKRQKMIEVDLKMAPMVLAELPHAICRSASGPVLINDVTGLPWSAAEFRRKWRIVANLAGVPKNVKNMDSRAGGITEAFDADANPDHIRLSATHSDISMTQRYNRGDSLQKNSNVHAKRLEFRRSKDAHEQNRP